MRKLGVMLAAGLMMGVAQPAQAVLVEQDIRYEVNGAPFQGYLVYDDAFEGQRPGVLVVHEWWGQNAYARRRARMLAQEGYTAFALDMFGEGRVANHPEDAKAFVTDALANKEAARERFMEAAERLKAHETTDPDQLAAIGYCFGGGVVLHMAATGAGLDAVASFHGGFALVGEPEPGQIKARVLVLHGGSDTMVTPEALQQFEAAMQQAGADFKVIAYPEAKHSFTNPDADAIADAYGLNVAYNAEADASSWEALLAFLGQTFKDE